VTKVSVNIFEGARRITLLVGITWIVGWVIGGFFAGKPHVFATFVIDQPGSPFVWSEADSCALPNASKWVSRSTSSGTDATLVLCFSARLVRDGRLLIPYRLDRENNTWWGNEPTSTEVQEYMREAGEKFSIPTSDEGKIDQKYWRELLKNWGAGALAAVIGLAVLFAFTWATGWVVRGFLGIPRGQDYKP
jgi:hypothetical protein